MRKLGSARLPSLILLGLAVAPAAAQAQQAPAPEPKLAELLVQADTIAAQVSKIRGLKIKRPIKRGVMNKAEISARLRKIIDEEYTNGEIQAEERTWKRLGLLPPGADYKQIAIELATEQVAGFYDPSARQLYIADWVSFGGDMAMAHEIDHALQDQHFDLRAFLIKPGKENRDVGLARQALIEGDGTALMVEYLLAQAGKEAPWADDQMVDTFTKAMGGAGAGMGGAALEKAPLILKTELIFPYDQGLRFVVHFRRHHSWRKVDAVFKKPPLSTEHILHPGKYDTYERPDEIAERPVAAVKGRPIWYKNVLGELTWRTFLRQHGVDDATSSAAVAGWGGDRLVLYGPAGEGTVATAVGYSVWDQEADAIEFFDAAVTAGGALAGGVKGVAAVDGLSVTYERAGEQIVVERRGEAVLLVIGVAPAEAAGLRDEVWKKWTVKRR